MKFPPFSRSRRKFVFRWGSRFWYLPGRDAIWMNFPPFSRIQREFSAVSWFRQIFRGLVEFGGIFRRFLVSANYPPISRIRRYFPPILVFSEFSADFEFAEFSAVFQEMGGFPSFSGIWREVIFFQKNYFKTFNCLKLLSTLACFTYWPFYGPN